MSDAGIYIDNGRGAKMTLFGPPLTSTTVACKSSRVGPCLLLFFTLGPPCCARTAAGLSPVRRYSGYRSLVIPWQRKAQHGSCRAVSARRRLATARA